MRPGAKFVRRAFTILELLIVITIVGILAALLLPSLSAAKARSHATVCRNHLRQMVQALQMYVHDSSSKYPHGIGPLDQSLDSEVGPANTGYWWAKLHSYYWVGWTNRAYHCPGYKGQISDLSLPNVPIGSYGYNEDGVAISGGGLIDPYRNLYIRFTNKFGLGPWRPSSAFSDNAIRENQVLFPSEMLALGETRWKGAEANGRPGPQDWLDCGLQRIHGGRGAGRLLFPFDPARHGKNYNSAFCDGHVSSMNPWILFNPTNTAPIWNYDHQPHFELWTD
jgi:prepilin-type N-terminal cleavage/methylation domain-containing protein/prepilin-type processing-associated H-X9-DG protein